jgi:outer membrane protein insertion porin family
MKYYMFLFCLLASFGSTWAAADLDMKSVGKLKLSTSALLKNKKADLSKIKDAGSDTKKKSGFKITDVQVRGNERTAGQIILLSIKSKIGDYLDKKQVMEDVKAIYQLGYFQTPPIPQTEKYGPGIRLVFYVHENPQVESITIRDNTLIPTEDILEVMNTKVGSVLNIRQLSEDLAKISDLYRDKGFIYSGIYNPAKQVHIEGTNITVRVKESKIAKINIEGTKKTRDYVVMRELLMEEGQLLDREKIADSLRNIQNLDYFEMQQPDIKLNPSSGDTEITLKLKDIKTGQASFGGGYSSVNGFIGFVDATERNFRGKGQTIRIKTQFGGERAYELGFTEPFWQGRRQAIGGSVFRTIIDRDDVRNGTLFSRFEERREGYSLFSSWRKRKDETLSVRFIDERVKTTLISGNPSDLFNDHQQTIGVTWVMDKRDNFHNPTKGVRQSFSFATTGGLLAGANNFNKYSYDFRTYKPDFLIRKNILAIRTKVGLAQKIDGYIPYVDLWSIGGAQTLRGYEDREFVGEKMWFTNVEFRYNFAKNFSAALFVDSGSAWDKYNGFDMKTGYGIGIRFKTPLGPFRLDLGRGTDRGKNKIHFGIGNTF